MKKKSRQNKDSEYTTAKKVRTEIFRYDLLPQEECLVIFAEMDKILFNAVSHIFESEMPYAENYIKDLILRVISGNTQSRNYYEKNDHEDEKKKKTKVLSTSECRFLKTAFNFLRPGLSVKSKKKILLNSRFLRGVLEDIVAFFMSQAEKIKAGETVHLNSLGNYNLSEVLGLYQELKPSWDLYQTHKESLIKPYLRLIYKNAKESSSSNTQTLNNFQNGYQGLVKAIGQYTPTRFAVFSLVAKTWIKQSILFNIKNEVNFIKLPVGVWNTYHKLEKLRQTMLNEVHTETETVVTKEQHEVSKVVTISLDKNEIELTTETLTEPKSVETASSYKVHRIKKVHTEITEEALAEAAGMDLAKVKRTFEAVKRTKVFSLDVPTSNEEEHGVSANWNRESVMSTENYEEKLELESSINSVEKIVQDFPDETRLIFGLATGCINLIKDPHFTKEELEKEIIMQRMALHNIEVIL